MSTTIEIMTCGFAAVAAFAAVRANFRSPDMDDFSGAADCAELTEELDGMRAEIGGSNRAFANLAADLHALAKAQRDTGATIAEALNALPKKRKSRKAKPGAAEVQA